MPLTNRLVRHSHRASGRSLCCRAMVSFQGRNKSAGRPYWGPYNGDSGCDRHEAGFGIEGSRPEHRGPKLNMTRFAFGNHIQVRIQCMCSLTGASCAQLNLDIYTCVWLVNVGTRGLNANLYVRRRLDWWAGAWDPWQWRMSINWRLHPDTGLAATAEIRQASSRNGAFPNEVGSERLGQVAACQRCDGSAIGLSTYASLTALLLWPAPSAIAGLPAAAAKPTAHTGTQREQRCQVDNTKLLLGRHNGLPD